MSRILVSILALVLISTGLWALSDTLFPSPWDDKAFLDSVIQLTGVIALVPMALAAFLAARPRFLEPLYDGLDKVYQLHKWLGITALAASVLHWWYTSGSHMFSSGAEGGGRPHDAAGAATQAVSLIDSLRGPAHPVGEQGFYIVSALILIALVTRIPYRWFAKSHLLMTPVLLALIFHGLLLMKAGYWSQPVGWFVVLTSTIGAAGGLLALARDLGLVPGVEGEIEALQSYPELHVHEMTIRVDAGWRGHRPGQFAFFEFSRLEGAHPFTIASDWDAKTRRITVIAKELGDFTAKLAEVGKPGNRVRLRGPYGRFLFEDAQPVQIWVGAGVGITPFVARMKYLARARGGTEVHLFHSTAEISPLAIQKMKADAAAAGVTLHLTDTRHDPKLDGNAIRAAVPRWSEASLWFCGPAGFGAALRGDLAAKGLPARRFHQERFAMR